mmetsp:Transcript_38850/g.62253  ORF Transcript_38850/g.62253 Transcript_38850/m.62253 type:complete len:241 (-) Transcript_38850:111-833(-)
MFSMTKRLKEAVSIMNGLDQKVFTKVLNRVAQKLGDQRAEKIFTTEEEEQLATILGLKSDQLDKVLSLSRYVFEQAAYQNSSASNLLESLTKSAGMTTELATVFSRVWHDTRRVLIKKLQKYTLGAPQVLKDTDWRFHLNMSSHAMQKEKELKAVLRLSLGQESELSPSSTFSSTVGNNAHSKNNSSTNYKISYTERGVSTSEDTNGDEDLCIELGREGLEELYTKLEVIQTQLDSLTKK